MLARTTLAAVVLLVPGLQECRDVRFLHPLSDAAPAVTEPSLEGRWTADAENRADFVSFERLAAGDDQYGWQSGWIQNGEESIDDSGVVTLIQADGYLIMDMAPDPDEVDGSEWLRLHSAYVAEVGDSLILWEFRVDSILAAETAELEGLVPMEADDHLIFGGPALNVLERLVEWAGRPGWIEPVALLWRESGGDHPKPAGEAEAGS